MKSKSHLRVQALVEGAISVALAQLLGYLKLFELPQGGSISFTMIPLVLSCVRWGLGPSLLMSFAYAFLQLMLDGGFAISWESILGDYLVAFTALGLGGACWRMKGGFYWGAIVGTLGRFICNYVTGAVVWAEYMPPEFFGMTMTSPWIYSALYNGFYAIANLAIACVVIFLLQLTGLKKWIGPAYPKAEKAKKEKSC